MKRPGESVIEESEENTMRFTVLGSRFYRAATLGAMVIVTNACSRLPPSAAQEVSSPARTSTVGARRGELRIVIIQDKTLSTGTTRTPQLMFGDLGPLLRTLETDGGELAAGVIHDRSNSGFARLRIDAAPSESG